MVIAQLLYTAHKKSTEAAAYGVHGVFTYVCNSKSDPESMPCLEVKYQQITLQQGVQAAFTNLEAAYNTDPNIRSDCHQITHVIGRTEADKLNNIDQAYAQGNNFCWSGYYHGVMEAIVSKIGVDELPAKIPTICAQIKAEHPYSFDHFNCVHGIGHGLMDVTYSDLFKSLKLCDMFTDSWEAQSCYGGVFMENIMDVINPDHHTNFIKAGQPMYPCTAVDDKYKEQCYLMQTSHALTVAVENFSTVFTECGNVESAYRDFCYQSLGRDSSGNSNSIVGPTVDNCMLGPTLDAQQNCIIGAVKDFVSYYHGETQATQLCDALNSSLKQTCLDTETQYYATF